MNSVKRFSSSGREIKHPGVEEMPPSHPGHMGEWSGVRITVNLETQPKSTPVDWSTTGLHLQR
ncbi:hypothetical protein Pure04_30510 [Paenarthrobacter ureafaciens]|nr:hypothetical protein Pure02_29920 [Paenarthrobacter ureafaciens]GLU69022.1 hypothetical protein Pure03_29980 [Paenarthrobacter ureafaciens]GLU73336.1 hypothetical protein Pure04_30510 [Paenarthrobacter ureafaciens]